MFNWILTFCNGNHLRPSTFIYIQRQSAYCGYVISAFCSCILPTCIVTLRIPNATSRSDRFEKVHLICRSCISGGRVLMWNVGLTLSYKYRMIFWRMFIIRNVPRISRWLITFDCLFITSYGIYCLREEQNSHSKNLCLIELNCIPTKSLSFFKGVFPNDYFQLMERGWPHTICD